MNNFKRVLFFAVIILFVILGIVFVQPKINFIADKEDIVNNDDNTNNETQNEEGKEEIIDEQESSVIEETSEEEQVNESSQQSNKNTPTTNNKNKSTNKTTTNNNSTVTEKTETNQTTTSPPVVKKEIWEELGITEYEYYHSPMTSGQKVTHSDMKSCQAEGDSKVNDSSSGYSQYWCMEVNSYSGDRLGYMLQLS